MAVSFDRLSELAAHALETALDGLRSAGSASPFLLFEEGVVRSIHRFDDRPAPSALDDARAATSKAGPSIDRYAIVHGGEITVGGETSRALFVDVGDRTGEALRFAQRYRRDTARGVVAVDARLCVGTIENLLGKDRFLVVVCPVCDAKNRVSLARIRAKNPICGACHKSLAA